MVWKINIVKDKLANFPAMVLSPKADILNFEYTSGFPAMFMATVVGILDNTSSSQIFNLMVSLQIRIPL